MGGSRKTEGITSYGYIVKNLGETVILASIKMAFRLFEAKLQEIKKEKALLESEERNRALLSTNPDIMFLLNSKGFFIDYHASDIKKLLVPPEKFLNRHVSKSLPQDLADLTIQKLKELFVFGEPLTYEYSLKVDEKTRYYESRLTSCGKEKAVSIVRDITNLKNSESQLRLLVSILDRSSDFIGVASADRIALYVNAAGQALVVINVDEAVRNTRVEEYFMAEDLPFVNETILPTLHKDGRWSGEFRFRHFKTGKPIDVYYDIFRSDDPVTGEVINYSTISKPLAENHKRI